MSLLFASVLVVLLTWLCWRSTRKPSRFPPGPPKFPIVGSLPFLNRCHLHLADQLRAKYGRVASFFIGGQPFVVISDYKLAKEAFKRTEFTNRCR